MDTLSIIFVVVLILLVVFGVVYRMVSLEKDFIVNYYSKEIHKVDSTDTRCHILNMTNCERINKFQMRRLLKKGYNGCRYCLPEFDTDKI